MNNTLHIYYATMTGNAEELARDAETRSRTAGWLPQLHNLSEASLSMLAETTHALFIVSTWGDGEPPDDAVEFFEELQEAQIDLSKIRYAILGLGDESYPDFNAFARNLDEELKRLMAKPIHPRVEADVDFDETYEFWIELVLASLDQKLEQAIHAK